MSVEEPQHTVHGEGEVTITRWQWAERSGQVIGKVWHTGPELLDLSVEENGVSCGLFVAK